tara:strand:- start:1955 stop:3028 length:1074 start_codon:yes stop_codon:yes gene_type:complete
VRERQKARRLVSRLLDWYDANERDLPWRQSRDAYGVWVSEVMLQQTQVAAVIPYWERWMRRLPTLTALARAREGTILKLWAGLGYYSRARNLQKAARVIVKEHGGEVPRDAEALRGLPGVGRYTAGAVASIAFDKPEPVVDGNVARVLARVFAVEGDVKSGTANEWLWDLAKAMVSATGRCGDLNQSLMELGAMVCRPRGAQCEVCPLKRSCEARRRGAVGKFPQVTKREALENCRWRVLVLEQAGRWLVRQRPAEGVNGGLWEFPTLELREGNGKMKPGWASGLAGGRVRGTRRWFSFKHSITRHRILVEAWRGSCVGGEGRWVTARELSGLALAGAHGKVWRRLREGIAVDGISC